MKTKLSQLFDHDFFSFSGVFVVVIIVSLVLILIASNFIEKSQQNEALDCVGQDC